MPQIQHPHFVLATIADIPRLLDMMATFYAIDQYAFNREMSERNMHLFIGHESLGRLWLIKHEREAIGYICASFTFSFEYGGRNALIDEFFIEAPYRSMGIGRQTLIFIERELKALGINALHLEVEPHNAKGNQLYEKQGFKGKGRKLLTKLLY
jgi:GNAT superfamily N-acetyltransferase